MKPARKRRLMIIGFILCGMAMAAALLFAALGSNMNHYYELKAVKSGQAAALGSNMNHYYELKAVKSGQAPLGKAIRIGGVVEKGSIKRQAGSLKVAFIITDLHNKIKVTYEGILPDLFREGQGVLAKGKLGYYQHMEKTPGQ